MRDLLTDEASADPELNGGANGARVGMRHPTFEATGRYTNQREHARGGMGRILLVHDEQLGRDVILKELLGDARNGAAEAPPSGRLRESTPVATRFVREARIAGQLEHPSIIPVHELGFRENGDLYYTMKYVQGVSLSESIASAANLEGRLKLLPHVLNVCQAIAYAHSRGVIHRDIKPANIMVGEFGETVIIDWGLARVKGAHEEANHGAIDMGGGDDSGKTTYGQVLGTPAYMAPEQAQGRTDAVDEHSDVYALGALVYTLLTGIPPFSGDNRDQIIRRAATGAPEPVRALESKAPAELVAICEKAMAKEPAHRYSSARDLAEELQRFLTGGLVSAHEYRFSDHLRRFARRHWNILATVAAAAVVVIGLSIYSYLHILGERDTAVEARNEALQERDKATKAQNDANEAREDAVHAREETQQQLYEASVALSYEATRQRRFEETRKALWAAPESYRHWEWGLLAALSNVDLQVFDSGDGAFSPDGRRIAAITSGDLYRTVKIWDASTWKLLHTLQNSESQQLNAVRFTPDSKSVIAPDMVGCLWVWDVESGAELLKFRVHPREELAAFAIDPRGETVAAATADGVCSLFDLKTGEKLRVFEGSAHPLVLSPQGWAWQFSNPADFSPDGRLVAAADASMATVWEAASGRRVFQLAAHEGRVNGLRFSPDSRWIATASADRTVRLWSTETGEPVRVLEGHMDAVNDVRFTPDGQHLFTCSADRTIAVWNVSNGTRERVIEGFPRFLPWFDINFTTQQVITRKLRVVTVVRSLLPLHDELEIGSHTGPVSAIAFSPDSRFVATGEEYRPQQGPSRVLVWDAASGRMRTFLDGHRGAINALAFLSDGNRLLSGSADGTAVLWDIDKARKLRVFAGHRREVSSLVLAPHEKTIATGSLDGTVWVWSLETGRVQAKFESGAGEVHCLARDPEGRYFAAGTEAGVVVVWDFATRKELARFKNGVGNAIAHSLAFSPDGQTLAIGDGGGRNLDAISRDTTPSVTLWDTATWACTATLKGPMLSPVGLQFHPDGGRLAAGCSDGSVRIWDPATGREVFVLTRDRITVACLAWSPDGMSLASGGSDGSAIIRRAFPWRAEDYPGDSNVALEERIQLARVAREQEAGERERLADEWAREIEQRTTCLAHLLRLDDAKLAWAEARNRKPEDSVASISDLQAYLADPGISTPCPSGGTWELGAVKDPPSCSVHGASGENAALMERFKDLQGSDQLEFKIILARLQGSPEGIQRLFTWLSAAQDENSPAFQSVLACLCDAPSVDPGILKDMALQWVRQEGRLFRSAVRLTQKAVELEPDNGQSWRILGYTELHAGQLEEAVTHFRRGLEKTSGASALGLALALITRGTEHDLIEACKVLEEYPSSEQALYTVDALEALEKAPPPRDSQLRERIQALLEKHKTP